MTVEEAVAEAEKIPGWMEPEELTWLGEMAAAHERIVEVGCYRGRSTKVLALMCPGTVYAVDSLKGEVDPPPVQFHAPPMEKTRLDQEFRESLADEIGSGKVTVIRRPSLSASKLFQAKSVGMVFIDANHTYPAPLKDIKAWKPKLKEGGLLCGHDAPDPGVEQSLNEVDFPHGRGPDRIWYAE